MVSAWYYVVSPLLGAVIGWTTNWLAIKMLFRPRREIRLLGLSICGLVPKRRAELTERIAEIVTEELIDREGFKKAMSSAELTAPLMGIVEERIEQFLLEKFRAIPAVMRDFIKKMPGGESLVREIGEYIKQVLLREVASHMPAILEKAVDAVTRQVDLGAVVVEKLDAIELEKFEAMVNRLARRELRAIELAGGVLGFIVGATQALVFCFLQFAR